MVNYINIFEVYMHEGKYNDVLIVCDHIDEVGFGADQRIHFMEASLSHYDLQITDVNILVGENCATNRLLIPPKGTSRFPSNPRFHQIRIPSPRGGSHLNQASRTQNPIAPKTVK